MSLLRDKYIAALNKACKTGKSNKREGIAEFPSLKPRPGRETKKIPSKPDTYRHTATKENTKYTGEKLLGIATMHKSNMVPVFSTEEATSVSQMRRN
jgi:hypothetical protein